jgi:hypothetical protein
LLKTEKYWPNSGSHKIGDKKAPDGTPLKSIGIGSMNFYKYM